MGWVKVIYEIIKWGIKLWPMISELLDLIKGLQDPQEKEALKVEVKRAAIVAKTTGDRRPLRELRDRLYKRRDGKGPRLA